MSIGEKRFFFGIKSCDRSR